MYDLYFNIKISEDNTSHFNEIKFLRDGELYKVSSIINIITSDNIYMMLMSFLQDFIGSIHLIYHMYGMIIINVCIQLL
jgi:hypothetical protein